MLKLAISHPICIPFAVLMHTFRVRSPKRKYNIDFALLNRQTPFEIQY